MNEFVETCRSEWKRLGVPDSVADEMAAELAADLEEAEADGASAEDVLGAGAFDPAALANAWAAERGVIHWPSPNDHRFRRSWRMPAVILALAVIAVVGAVLVIVVSPSALERQTTFPFPPVLAPAPLPHGVVITPDAGTLWVTEPGLRTILNVGTGDAEDNSRTVGSVLLTIALLGIVFTTSWWWLDPRRR